MILTAEGGPSSGRNPKDRYISFVVGNHPIRWIMGKLIRNSNCAVAPVRSCIRTNFYRIEQVFRQDIDTQAVLPVNLRLVFVLDVNAYLRNAEAVFFSSGTTVIVPPSPPNVISSPHPDLPRQSSPESGGSRKASPLAKCSSKAMLMNPSVEIV